MFVLMSGYVTIADFESIEDADNYIEVMKIKGMFQANAQYTLTHVNMYGDTRVVKTY